MSVTWPSGALWRMVPGLLLAAVALGLYLTISKPGPPTVLSLTQRQLAAASIHLEPPSGPAPRLVRFTAAQAEAVLQLGAGWALNRAALLSYTDLSRQLTCDPCWVFDAIPPWGLRAVSGGPRGAPCFQNSGRMTFFLAALDARSGRVVDIVGSNAEPNGHPLPLGHRVSCLN
ncbi:MAG: hypothetical protein M0T72_00075 [Candidatus Dormibacteraeota bacterium]|nr:hypothetical protein [Candidatus Dormibacteraeota bacterium]